MSDTFIIVRRQPNNYQTAKYLLSSFEDPHWGTVSGGVQTTMFNQPFIYGYVQCTDAVEGEVAHSGIHGPCPHRIKVCALKKDNEDIYGTLLEIVGLHPTTRSSVILGRSIPKAHAYRCTYREIILSLLNRGVQSEDSLWKHFVKKEYLMNISAIRSALTKLEREGQIACEKDPTDRKNNLYRLIKPKP